MDLEERKKIVRGHQRLPSSLPVGGKNGSIQKDPPEGGQNKVNNYNRRAHTRAHLPPLVSFLS